MAASISDLHDAPVRAGTGDRLQREAGLLGHAPRQRACEDAGAGLPRERGRRRPIATGRCRGRRCRLRGRGCACSRRGFGCGLSRCGCGRRYGRSGYLYAVESRCILALLQDQADDRIYSHPLGAGWHHDPAEGALVGRLHLHRRLVGFDLAQDIAGSDLIPLALEPARDIALGHRRREGRHQNLDWHVASLMDRPRQLNPRPLLLDDDSMFKCLDKLIHHEKGSWFEAIDSNH